MTLDPYTALEDAVVELERRAHVAGAPAEDVERAAFELAGAARAVLRAYERPPFAERAGRLAAVVIAAALLAIALVWIAIHGYRWAVA